MNTYMMTHETYTGGCQCGALRYRIEGPLGHAEFCYCRMCQKAFGSMGAPLFCVDSMQFHWTRGTPGIFRSSPTVDRGFCRDCGTPMFMLEDGDNPIEISLGTLDDPNTIEPVCAVGVESKPRWADILPTLPTMRTDDCRTSEELGKLGSLQHPDHDTTEWPTKKS